MKGLGSGATGISELSNELRRRIEEVKAQLNAKSNAKATSPYPSLLSQANFYIGDQKKRGLNTECHPALSTETATPRIRARHPGLGLMPKAEFATVKANQRVAPQLKEPQKPESKPDQSLIEFSDPAKNKYFDSSLQSLSSRAPRMRNKRPIKFIKKGKFVNEANKLRAKIEMERLKREIEKSVKRTGMNVELELVSDKFIRVDPPPAIEWWDAQLAPSGYNRLGDDDSMPLQKPGLITNLVQHPVPVKPPREYSDIKPMPIMLTKKERKKFKRQRSLERQKEKTDKIRLGLLPQEQPKAKIKNMMLIFKNEAIRDPTKIELKVKTQMASRKQKHRNLVESMKLTPEQKRLKRKRKLEEDANSNFTETVVFRTNDLSSMKIRFKIYKNALQMNLTGIAVINPGLCVIIIEGGPKAIKFYKKLMLRRIDWSNNSLVNNSEDAEDEGGTRNGDKKLTNNKCYLIWEGRVKERVFNFFKIKSILTDSMCREYFEKMHCVHYWEAARNYIPDESEKIIGEDPQDLL